MSRPAGPMGRDGTVPYGNSHGTDDVYLEVKEK
jgi:hypothetical protein